jgi:sulfite reductase beta subunit-like hemoprotein
VDHLPPGIRLPAAQVQDRHQRLEEDRAAIEVHDIGLEPVRNAAGELGFRVLVGGGLGRTPVVGAFINEFLPWQDLLSYLDAILRVYNRYGRRDNKYKARIKILVKALTRKCSPRRSRPKWSTCAAADHPDRSRSASRRATSSTRTTWPSTTSTTPPWTPSTQASPAGARATPGPQAPGYVAVTLSLKPTGVAPGDITDKQLDAVADLAERYSFGQLRTSHEQNIILADVEQRQLHALWLELREGGFATPNIGLLTDIICCPGGDFCSLANAKSIPIAESIQRRFDDLDYLFDIGELDLNISGCMNACGHHHVGHIGILGVDKKGEEFYQVSLGGNAAAAPAWARSSARPSPRMTCRRDREADRRVRRTTYRRRALHRHLPAYRHRPLQGTRLCSESLRTTRSSTKPGTCCPRTSIDELTNCDDYIVPLHCGATMPMCSRPAMAAWAYGWTATKKPKRSAKTCSTSRSSP